MLLGGLPLLFLSISAHEPAVSGHFSDLDSNDFLALLYTSVFGCAVSYGVFFYNASRGTLSLGDLHSLENYAELLFTGALYEARYLCTFCGAVWQLTLRRPGTFGKILDGK